MNLTLTQAWTLCIEQWDDVKAEIEAGSKLSVEELKEAWATEHDSVSAIGNCFFCKFVVDKDESCNECPGRKIDKNFDCMKRKHHYKCEPLAFHAEIHRLYEIFKESEK